MSVEWKDQDVNDHSSGVTDLVTAATPDFQEISENLTHNVKLQILSSRDGYRRYTEQQTGSKIRQLFKLEDWVLAFCYDDPLVPGDPINGQIYFRLESDTTSPWQQIPTPKARDTGVIFRLLSEAGKGLSFTKSAPIFDQIVVKVGVNAGPSPFAPIFSISGRTIFITVDKARLTADLKYDRTTLPPGAGTLLTWQYLITQLTSLGWAVTPMPGTVAADVVIFDGNLTVQTEPTQPLGLYPSSVRSDGTGAPTPLFTQEGHIQSSEWQSHLYMAFEPFDKSYAPNPLDPFGKDPESYPPINKRIPLRKISPVASAPEITPLSYTPSGMNAQLPSTMIGLDTERSPYDSGDRFQVYVLQFEYSNMSSNDLSGTVEFWAEYSWGRIASSMADEQYAQYVQLNANNPIDDDNAFSIGDWNVRAVAPYSSIPIVEWGKIYICYHQTKGGVTRPQLTYQEAVDQLNEALREYNNRSATILGTVYYAAYDTFGFYLKQNPEAKTTQNVDGVIYINEAFTADSLPEEVPGNFQYEYSFYLRQSYEGLFEGSPREFIFDGPASFIQVRSLSAIGTSPIRGRTKAPTDGTGVVVTHERSPMIYGGISASMDHDDTLFNQSNMVGVFARSLDGGDVLYIDELSKSWFRTADFTLPDNLITDGWDVKTSWILPHQSNTPDDDLQFNEPSYTNGGVASYDTLPQGPYYFDINNQVGYSANIVNNIQRVYESVPGIPHSTPLTFFEDFDDEITGLTHFHDKEITTTQNKLWRIEGQRAADGSGRTYLRTISDEYGCIANQSIVVSNIGVFLWSNTGIIYTDGVSAQRVSEHLIERYNGWLKTVRQGQPIIGPRQLRGRYDELNRLVFWSLFDSSGKPFFVVLSLQKGISQMMPITVHTGIRFRNVDRLTGLVTETDYFQTHATCYSDDYQRWYRGQGRFLMVADPAQTHDESEINDLDHPIVPFYKSIAFSFGIPWARKQTSKIMLYLRDQTGNGVSMSPLGWNDLDKNFHRLGNCLNYQHLPFALSYATGSLLDLEQFFRHTDCHWVSEMLVNYKRIFGRGLQRQCYKQVGFTALKLFFFELSIETPGVMDLQITFMASFPEPTAVVRVLGGTIPPELGDHSGRFYISWDKTMDPVPISGVDTDGTYSYITALTESDPVSSGDYTERWPDIKIYRLFTDQRIDMIGYNLTYRLIGDRTHGAQKSAAKGGVSA